MEKQSTTRWQAVGQPLAAGIALVLLVVLAYTPAYSAGFIWDDDEHFTANFAMYGEISSIWSQHDYYYPLTSTVWWIALRLWRLNPFPYHLLNVLIHAMNGILLWRLLRLMNLPVPWFAAAVWALHPVNVQSVAWATELKNCLSGAFYLGAMISWHRSAEGAKRWWWYGLTLILSVGALLSKTSTVTLPAALLLMEWLRHKHPSALRIVTSIPVFALSLGAGLWTIAGHNELVATSEWEMSLSSKCMTAIRCVGFYAVKLVWPFGLSFVYPRWDQNGDMIVAVSVGTVFLGVVAHSAWLWRKGHRSTAIALAYFVGSLFPVLNFFRMYYARYSFVADHWQYLASMGAIAWLTGVAAWLVTRSRIMTRKLQWRVSAAVLLLAGLSALTGRQSRNYQDMETLWNHVLHHDPKSWIANNNLAQLMSERGEHMEAFHLLYKALDSSTSPSMHDLSRTNLALIDFRLGRFETALAKYQELQKEIGGKEVMIAMTLASLRREDEAREQFLKAMEGEHRLDALLPYSLYLREHGQVQEAITLCEEYVEARPHDTDGRMLLSKAFSQAGKITDAIRAAEDARQQALLQGRDKSADLIGKHLWQLREAKPQSN